MKRDNIIISMASLVSHTACKPKLMRVFKPQLSSVVLSRSVESAMQGHWDSVVKVKTATPNDSAGVINVFNQDFDT